MDLKNLAQNAAKLAKEVAIQYRELDLQTGKAKVSLEAALLPVAQEILPDLIRKSHDFAEFVASNKEPIKEIGYDLAQVFRVIAIPITLGLEGLKTFTEAWKELGKTKVDFSKQFDKLEDFAKFKLHTSTEYDFIDNPYVQKMAEDFYKKEFEKIKAEKEKAEKTLPTEITLRGIKGDTVDDKSLKELQKEREAAQEASRARALKDHEEYEKLVQKATKNSIDAQLQEIERWRKERLSVQYQTAEELESIEKLAEERRRQVLQPSYDNAKKLHQETLDSQYKATHNSLENELYDIEQWKKANLNKAYTAEEQAAVIERACEREARAYEEAANKAKAATQSFEDDIFRLTHSDYENQLYKIAQRAKKGLEEGVDAGIVDKYVNLASQEAKRNTRGKRGAKPLKYTGAENNPYFYGEGSGGGSEKVTQAIQPVVEVLRGMNMRLEAVPTFNEQQLEIIKGTRMTIENMANYSSQGTAAMQTATGAISDLGQANHEQIEVIRGVHQSIENIAQTKQMEQEQKQPVTINLTNNTNFSDVWVDTAQREEQLGQRIADSVASMLKSTYAGGDLGY